MLVKERLKSCRTFFSVLLTKMVSELMAHFRRNIEISLNLTLMTSGALNIDMSEKLAEVVSKRLLTRFRTIICVLWYDVLEPS